MAVIRIKSCNDTFQASILKAQLNQAGIECFLTNELSSDILQQYGGMMNSGVQIMIDEKDKLAALEILSISEKVTTMACPHCKSINVASGPGRKWAGKYMLLLLSILFFIPLGNRKQRYYCRDCGREF